MLCLLSIFCLQIGLKVEGVDLASIDVSASHSGTDAPTPESSVVIVGMRGSGKTFIGELAATSLGWNFIDADPAFEEYHKIGVREFVQQQGWPAFRAAETEILKSLLESHPTGYVISLGGGIVETPAARDVLKDYAKKAPVVHVVREIDEVLQYLGEETARPAYGEPIIDVFRRREPWFAECRSHEFINYTGVLNGINNRTADTVRRDVARFFKHVTGQEPNLANNLTRDKRSYFLSLTYPDITPALPHIEELSAGVDALELRVDLLRAPKDVDLVGPYLPPVSYVCEQVASIRQKTSLPIVFTVRTVSQGGNFPDHAEKEAFELFHAALRLGIEYIDVETSWSEKRIRELVSHKGYSQIIASWHDWSGKLKWTGQAIEEIYQKAADIGDIVKIVSKANSLQDNFALYSFVDHKRSVSEKPIIAINMGVEGQMSRILNRTFSPVTHPLLPNKAAPGQLSFAQIQNALHLIGQLSSLRFYLFGTPIAHSMSPTLHNTGFRILNLPHKYELLETTSVNDEIKAAITAPDFGGASVTIPFKLDVIPLLDTLSPEAEIIGAVNTIIPVRTADGIHTLHGDNTDWIGIRNCIIARLPASLHKPEVALVIGAGGTSRAAIYALSRLGIKTIYLFNRTKASAQVLVDTFSGLVNIQIVASLTEWPGPPPSIIVSTVPASATTFDPSAGNALYLPSQLFNGAGGVVVDMAYKPEDTPLLTLAAKQAENWEVVRGVDVLLEQGFAQFHTWTDRHCPRRAVSDAVWKAYRTT